MLDFSDDPVFVRDLLDFVVEMELRFAKAQMEAGVELMGWATQRRLWLDRAWVEFVFPAQKKLVDGLKAMGLRTRSHICGNTLRIMQGRGELGYDIVDVDALVSMADARSKMPAQVYWGTSPPLKSCKQGSPEDVLAAVSKCHEAAGELYIIAAGCEVPRDTPAANMFALGNMLDRTSPAWCLRMRDDNGSMKVVSFKDE